MNDVSDLKQMANDMGMTDKEIEEVFGKKQRSLKLYVRLITKTTLSHEKAIKKHIKAFRDFCISNRDALEVKDA